MPTIPYFVVVGVALLISLGASVYCKSTFRRFSKTANSKGLTGSQFAEQIIWDNGMSEIQVNQISGELTDNYNHSAQTLNLSSSTYSSASVSAIGVAAHETGHALQYHTGYFPVRLRAGMATYVKIGSNLGVILAIAGAAIENLSGLAIGGPLITAGIILYSLTFLFTLVTLPVEFNASRRAVKLVKQYGFGKEETAGIKKVLRAAALTYVASMVTSLLYLLRFISIFGKRRR